MSRRRTEIVNRPDTRNQFRAAVLAALAALFTACGPANRSPDPAPKTKAEPPLAPKNLKTTRAELRPMERTITVFGSLAPLDHATLSTKVAGRLQSVAVDLGSAVRQGDLLAQIEPQDFELRLRQTEAALGQARARLGLPLSGDDDKVDLDATSTVQQARVLLEEAARARTRTQLLVEKNIAPKAELDAAQAAHDVAFNKHRDALEEVRNRQAQLAERRAELAIARQQLADTRLIAPFDGVVQERHARRGESLNVGSPIANLVRMDALRLRLEVPEREAARLQVGQLIRFRAEGLTNTFVATLQRLSPAIREDNRMLAAEADVKNPGTLRPGQFTRTEIVIAAAESVLCVPRGAIVTFAGIEKVFILKDGRLIERAIRTGRVASGWTEVLEGLKAGEEIAGEAAGVADAQVAAGH